VSGGVDRQYLLPDQDLRHAYGDVIGLLAESHWWSPHELLRLP